MLDAMLPWEIDDEVILESELFSQRAEEARQLARFHIERQQTTHEARYNLRRREVKYNPGDHVWVWTPIRRPGVFKKLLHRYFGPYRVLRRITDVNYEVILDGTVQTRRQPRADIVHVVRMKPYFAR